MASIERTAYPRFRRNPSAKELDELYTPTAQERAFIVTTARGDDNRLNLLLWLKTFQTLGYFPALSDVPLSIVAHLRTCLALDPSVQPGYDHPRTLYRHHQTVRTYLRVNAYDKQGRHIAIEAIGKAAHTMDNPADLINVAIEELIRQRYELPAFSTLDRIMRRVRTLVNAGYYRAVLARISEADQKTLDNRLVVDLKGYSDFRRLKELPQSPTVAHLKEIQNRLKWLLKLGDYTTTLADLPTAKTRYFAAQAQSLDASELADYSSAKRYTFLVCLIHQAQIATRDDLVEMFLKRMAAIHNKAKEELVRLRDAYRETTETLVGVLTEIVQPSDAAAEDDAAFGERVRALLKERGGNELLLEQCTAVSAYNGNNYLPLLPKFYRSARRSLFAMLTMLSLTATSQDESLTKALTLIRAKEEAGSHAKWLPATLDLNFANMQWQRLVRVKRKRRYLVARQHFEICAFTYLALELKTGDMAVAGSEKFADYRTQLLTWAECKPLVADYCRELGLPPTAPEFVKGLKEWLTTTAERVDKAFPENKHLVIGNDGQPKLARPPRKPPLPSLSDREAAVRPHLPERHILDILRNADYWSNLTRHFGPLSGADPKLDRAPEKYLITTFAYGCNLGATQTARHMGDAVSAHQLSFVNRRHVTSLKLDAAIRDVVNCYNRCALPHFWGNPKVAGADGTKLDLSEENLISEYHIRYGGYGGIAYHHVSDTYVALFSHFIGCGVWEAVYIIDGLLRNRSDIQPDTLHADTQGQSTPVFAIAYLLGIKLMPRIRNWHDLIFYRPTSQSRYDHINGLFGDAIDWNLIETHWQDMMQVVLSIRAGKVLPSTLLRKLNNYSRKNRLYQAMRELGRAVRTVFLLQYISDIELREQITATTNKVEAYNRFSKWLFFGGEGTMTENDPDEMEKRVKYTDLVANAVMLQNTVDLTYALRQVVADGYLLTHKEVQSLSPYLTRNVKRFGDYTIDLSTLPDPLDGEMLIPLADAVAVAPPPAP